MNLLDTPGHNDFSEDTYRTLTAVDAVMMVIDATKGVETQTEKLLEVCKRQRTPVITFMNKLDLEAMDPLDGLANLQDKLGMEPVPFTWPIGKGKRFQGVYDLRARKVVFYEAVARGKRNAVVKIDNLDDALLEESIGVEDAGRLRDE